MLPFETAAIIISLVIILLFLTVQPAVKLKLDSDTRELSSLDKPNKPNKPPQMNEIDVIESFAGTLPLGRSMDMPSYTYNLSSVSNNWEHTVVNDMYGDDMNNKS